jgi:hypothetical protein
LTEVLERAARGRAKGRGADGRLDLTISKLVVAGTKPRARAADATISKTTLTRVYDSIAMPESKEWAARLANDQLGERIDPLGVRFFAGEAVAGQPANLPLRFGNERLSAFFDGAHAVARYGKRYLAIATDDAVLATVDLGAWMPARATEDLDVRDAVEADGTLFVGLASFIAPSTSRGRLDAVDWKTGELLYRFAAAGAVVQVVVEGDLVLAAVSAGAASGSLVALDRATGVTRSVVPLHIAPRRLGVETFDGVRYVVALGDGRDRVGAWVGALTSSAPITKAR